MTPAEFRVTLEEIARLAATLPCDKWSVPDFGCGVNEESMSALIAIGANRDVTIYGPGTFGPEVEVIEGARITIGGMTVHSQGNRRPATPAEILELEGKQPTVSAPAVTVPSAG